MNLRSMLAPLALTVALSPALTAQFTSVPPFAGQISEDFEPGGPARAFQDHADITTPGYPGGFYLFYGWLVYVGYTVYPMGGSNLFGGTVQGHAMITFDDPVRRFGGYFATVGYLAGGQVILRDETGAVISTTTLQAPRGSWAWDGWDVGHTGAKIKSVELWCNDPYNGGALLCLENLEADLSLGELHSTPMGCGTLSLAASGYAELGDTISLSLGSGAASLSGFILGDILPPVALPFCPSCTVGVNGIFVSGNSYVLDVPTSTSLLDFSFAAQGYRFNGGPCLGGFSLSNRVEAYIGLPH